jgi:hypothetical protein
VAGQNDLSGETADAVSGDLPGGDGSDGQAQPLYGAPVDVLGDVAAKDVPAPEFAQPLYGVLQDVSYPDLPATDVAPVDVPSTPDVPADCMPVAFYGPEPCTSDADCVAQFGAGWYCDQNNSYDNGCGGTSTWPVCTQGPAELPPDVDAGPDAAEVPLDCGMAVAYGPPSCGSDADCASRGLPGYVCQQPTDPCGWATCVPGPVDADVSPDAAEVALDCGAVTVMYGMLAPCSTDEQCVAEHDGSWYCDTTNPCRPTCVEKP